MIYRSDVRDMRHLLTLFTHPLHFSQAVIRRVEQIFKKGHLITPAWKSPLPNSFHTGENTGKVMKMF